MELAEKVRNRRIELGMSQDDLARKMGYSSRSSINKIEMGRPITQKIIVRLAKALNVTVAYLMGWEEAQNSNVQKWNEMTKGMEFTEEELGMIIDYAKYLLSKRDK